METNEFMKRVERIDSGKVAPQSPGKLLSPTERAGFLFIFTICLIVGSWGMLTATAYLVNGIEPNNIVSTAFNWAAWVYFIASISIGGPLLGLWGYTRGLFQ